ncbi:hypothetical protein [Mesobacillus selenatarsenatis]|uniref:RiboL-PSP-HEPN domain-containing protein n=1 Tax=Mesobacillus selenatarsenatis (strain DSM 18680 / JCM 14380 / FERM P-15431 / SF-1) TaxID=1321606 RepID=A0A0A8X2W4_MESS1|nr:hypothetical protein [Mesobacillus selenatarsenatis]GAM14278.1 hypothetical protein SAMD00020551_2427 [Mesobacillus selenatarsenatis SF-1]
MSKKVAFETLDELLKTLELKRKYPSKRLEKILIRNYILSLYTIWETYAKNKIYDTYSDFEYILHTEEFIKRYLKKSFGKSYLSKEFLKDIKDTKVKKEILCQSNNLNWTEFAELFSIVGLDINPLVSLIDDSEEIEKIVNLLKSSGLIPVHTNISTRLSGSVSGYFQLVVDLRNTISHTYKMEIGEQLNSKQMTLLIHLFKCTINLIEKHIETEISKKYIESSNLRPVISVTNVIRGCNASGNQEAIIEINVLDQTIDQATKKLVIKSATNSGYCNISGIRIGNFNLNKIPLNKTCTLTVTSTMKIRNGYQYELCMGPHKSTRSQNIIQYA